jgi:MFS family permease
MRIYGIKVDPDLALGLLTGCVPIGAGIGALSSNYLLGKYSRRYFLSKFRQSILIVNTIALIAGSLIFIENFIVLLLIRLIQGLCVGAYSALVPILIK